jgi:hypothetical protein
MRALRLVGTLVAFFIGTARPAVALHAVTTCNAFTGFDSVELTGDLDCSGAAGLAAITMFRGRIFLNGFTLTAPTGGVAIRCDVVCKIIGPGTLVGGVSLNGHTLPVYDVTMIGSGGTAFDGTVDALKLVRVVVTGFDAGVAPFKSIKMVDSTMVGTGTLGTDGLGWGIRGATARVTLKNSSVSGFGGYGVGGDRVRLIDSTVIDNGNDPGCSGFCGDLLSVAPPRLVGTSSCGTSIGWFSHAPWGVCTND